MEMETLSFLCQFLKVGTEEGALRRVFEGS